MRVTIDQGRRTSQDGVIRLTESCEQVTGMPNSQEAPPTVDTYLTKLAELMVVPHIAHNGSDSNVLTIILPPTSKYNPPPLAPRATVGTDMIRHWSHTRQKGWGYPPKKTACQSGLRFQRYKPLKSVTTAGRSYSDF